MRKSAWFGRSVGSATWVIALGCVPQQELSTYSEGAVAPALEEPGEGPGGVMPAAMGPLSEAPQEPAEPSDTPAGTDGPAQPEQLAPAEPALPASPAQPPAADAEPTEPAPATAAPPAAVPPSPPAPAVDATMGSPPAGAPAPVSAPPSAQFRFVRLVADSEFNGGPLSSAAELDVLGADGQPLDRSGWLATADSAEPTFVGGAPAALVIDGLPGSVWHTAWFQLAAPPAHPHFLQLDLGEPRSVTGFRYLARQDASVGRVADYRFFVSADGVEWGEPLLAGRLLDTAQPQDVRVPAP